MNRSRIERNNGLFSSTIFTVLPYARNKFLFTTTWWELSELKSEPERETRWKANFSSESVKFLSSLIDLFR